MTMNETVAMILLFIFVGIPCLMLNPFSIAIINIIAEHKRKN